MSMASCMVAPTPTAAPFTAAITGFRLSKMRRVSRPPPSRWTPHRRASPPRADRRRGCRSRRSRAPAERSAPAQKPRPAPVTITQRTASSASVSVEGGDHVLHHLGGEGVELVGAVQRDGGDAVLHANRAGSRRSGVVMCGSSQVRARFTRALRPGRQSRSARAPSKALCGGVAAPHRSRPSREARGMRRGRPGDERDARRGLHHRRARARPAACSPTA